MVKEHLLLIIEDNPLLTEMYKEAFERRDMKVLVAHDGETGIKFAKEEKPELVLLDVRMPGGADGFEVLKQLKENPETKDIAVIMLTIIAFEKDKARAKELGAVDYLFKQEAKLDEVVDRVLAHLPK